MLKSFPLVHFFCQDALGQTTEIDSLKQLLSVEQQNDKKTELIRSLVNLASNVNLSLGLEYARMGVSHVDKIDDKTAQPEFYEMKGRIHANLLELDSAAFILTKPCRGIMPSTIKKDKPLLGLK